MKRIFPGSSTPSKNDGKRIVSSNFHTNTNKQKFILQIADADGFNARTVFSSTKQLMSPTWSPDGSRLAYVSFETGNSAIFVQDIIRGTRSKISGKAGINSAPAWSPDGRYLAMYTRHGADGLSRWRVPRAPPDR